MRSHTRRTACSMLLIACMGAVGCGYADEDDHVDDPAFGEHPMNGDWDDDFPPATAAPETGGWEDTLPPVDTLPVDTLPMDTLPVDALRVDTIPPDTSPPDTGA